MKQLLTIEHLEKYYGTGTVLTKALDGISFKVNKGEFVGIMGASGSGKSTLLNCVSTIDIPTGGNIYLNGENILKISHKKIAKFRRENLGFVFQEFNLLNTLTVGENIGLSMGINKKDKDETANKVLKVAKQLNIADIIDKFPYEISGGQRQRCACARAIIHKPAIIMADEPTGALDTHSSMLLLKSLKSLNEKNGATILMVTHDAISASYCSRVIFLKDGKIFNEFMRGDEKRQSFYQRIINVMTILGGDNYDD